MSIRQTVENWRATTGREIAYGLRDVATGQRAGTSEREAQPIKDVEGTEGFVSERDVKKGGDFPTPESGKYQGIPSYIEITADSDIHKITDQLLDRQGYTLGSQMKRIRDAIEQAKIRRNQASVKSTIARDISKESMSKQFEVKTKYQEDLRIRLKNTQDPNEKLRIRAELKKDLYSDISKIRADARLKRIEEGVVTSAVIQTTGGDIKVTGETAKQFREQVGLIEIKTPKKDSAIIESLKSKGISEDRPGGKAIIKTIGFIEKSIDKTKDFFVSRKGFFTDDTKVITTETGEKIEVPVSFKTDLIKDVKDKDKDKVELPISTIGPAPTIKERVIGFPGFIKGEAKEKFGQIFIPEDPTFKFRETSAREIIGGVSAGFLIRGPKIVGQLPGTIAEQLGFEGIKTITPETEIPVKRTITEGQDITGLTIAPQEVITFTPTELKKVGGFAGEAAAITIAPTSALLVGGAAITTAPKEAQITKQERLEGAFIFGLGAVTTASKLRSIRRIAKARTTGDFSKLKKRELEQLFLTKPELKLAELRSKKVTELVRTRARKKLGIRADLTDDATVIGISTQRPGGKVVTRTLEPTETLAGKVKEVRKIGGKTKTFTGKGEITNLGEYTEVVDLGKNLQRITFVDDAGVGTVRIVKKGKVIIEKPISTNFLDDLSKIKPEVKVTKIKIDQKSTSTKNILESKITAGKQRVEITKVTDDAGNIIISDTKEDLTSRLLKGDIKQKGALKRDPITGVVEFKEEATGFLDIIETGPRKGLLQIKTKDKSILIKKRAGQEIVFGKDEPLDLIARRTVKDESMLRKFISPKVDREIIEGSQRRIVTGFVKPDPTDLAKTKKAQEKLIKILKKDVIKEQKLFDKVLKQQLAAKEVPKKVVKEVTEESPKLIILGEQGSGQQVVSKFVGPSGLPDDAVTFIAQDLPQKVVVQPTSQFLVQAPTSEISSIPLVFDAKLSGKVLPVGGLIAPAVGTLELQQQPTLQLQPQLQLEQQRILQKQQLTQQPVLQSQPQLQLEQQLIQQKVLQKQQVLQKVKLKLQQKQKQEQVIQQQFQQILQKQQPKLKEKMKFTPPPIVPPTTSLGKALKKVKEMKKDSFEVFVKKFGEDVSVGFYPTKQKAKEELITKLKSTIRAGGFIEKEGKKIPFGELGILGGEFRPSKKDIFRVIQRKEKRLGMRGETSELQYFRTKPSKKIKGRKNLFRL